MKNWKYRLLELVLDKPKEDAVGLSASFYLHHLEAFIQSLLEDFTKEMIGEEKNIIENINIVNKPVIGLNNIKAVGYNDKRQELIKIALKYGVEV